MNEESEGPESLKALFCFVARRLAHWEGVVEIVCEGEERTVARNFCGSLLLIMQEAVGNAIRHGKAEKVVVKISFRPSELVLTITDNGTGFDTSVSAESGHYGLSTMQRRVFELSGTMNIESRLGGGTCITVVIPS